MSEHHHHHHHRDGASRFKERSLNAIYLRRQIEKYLKVILMVFAVFIVTAVTEIYTVG